MWILFELNGDTDMEGGEGWEKKGVIFVRRGRRAGNIAMTTSHRRHLCKAALKGRPLWRWSQFYALRDGGCQESPMF